MTWAATRRLGYALGVLVCTLLLASPWIYTYMTIPATCTDGIQNQGEDGVDSGGPCIVRTESSILPVTVRFAKVFTVDKGVYSVVGYVENPNHDVGVLDAEYEFVLYDEKGIFIAQRRGQVRILPQAVTPIFEAKIVTGSQIPARADLTFRPKAQWQKMERHLEELMVSGLTQEQILRTLCPVNEFDCTEEYLPRVRAKITNTGLNSFADVPVTAVVFDRSGNAIAASRTVVATLVPRQTVDVVYTWNIPFTSEVSRIDIIPVPYIQ